MKHFKLSLEKILIIILIGIAAGILLTTVLAFASDKAQIAKDLRKEDPSPQKIINQSQNNTKLNAFTELGQVRAVTKKDEDQSYSIVVIKPWFSYPAGDSVLLEELYRKEKQFVSIIQEYYASRTKNQIRSIGEEKIKSDLKKSINENLVLGKINDIYFDEYLFFE